MKIESLIKIGFKACIYIPFLGYLLVFFMVANYVAHTGSLSPSESGGLTEFTPFAPMVMYVFTVLNLISVYVGIILHVLLVLITRKISYKDVILQVVEIVILLWILHGKINGIPVLWFLFD